MIIKKTILYNINTITFGFQKYTSNMEKETPQLHKKTKKKTILYGNRDKLTYAHNTATIGWLHNIYLNKMSH